MDIKFLQPFPDHLKRFGSRREDSGKEPDRKTDACIRGTLPLEIALLRDESSFGQIAQSVEQRTENPRVPGSIPGLATTIIKELREIVAPFLFFLVSDM
jgi:hypothetical protein